jgi:Ribosomal protein L7/L12 C-terminal domain
MNEPILFASLATMIIVASLGYRLVSLENRLAALTRLDGKLDLLLKNAGLAYDPYIDIPLAVADALRSGQSKIQAIRLYREATGAGLAQAKDAVEQIMRKAGKP